MGVAVALSVTMAACRDTNLTRPIGSSSPRSITPRVIVTRDTGATALVTVALDVSSTVGKLGSFTGRVHFDPAALVYVGDISLGDGTMRASNRVNDVVRVAGISTTGINVAQLATFRFRVVDPAALERLYFELEEVHELSRGDLLSLVRSPTAPRAP